MVSIGFRNRSHAGLPGKLAIMLGMIGVCLVLGSAGRSLGGTIVRFDTTLGSFDVELFDDVVPTTVDNFLTYVNSGRYANTVVHRTTSLATDGLAVVQGGGFDRAFNRIPTDPPIPLEYVVPNTRGTIGMARTYIRNSATSQWFINTSDNSDVLNEGNPFAVFGQVMGDGMDVVDAIHALPTFLVAQLQPPLYDYTPGVDDPLDHTVVVNNVTVVPEPSTGLLALCGVVIAAIYLRPRRKGNPHP